MKVLGIFRGFPGLGRVVGGVSILEILRDTYGFKVKGISYLQGNEYLKSHGFQIFSDVSIFDYCSIGLLPTNYFAKEINCIIKEFVPDIIIIDGEPLMVQSIKISYPEIKIVALLNPSDVENEANDVEAMDFFNASYQLADLAIIHGNRSVKTNRKYKQIISIPTIIRDEVTKINRKPSNVIYCVLGGGTLNVGSLFLKSTVQIGTLCIEAARIIPKYKFVVLCSCKEIYDTLCPLISSSNVILEKEIANATDYYKNASMIITRSGRNTIGEVAYLGIPTITFVSGCEYRRAEQLKNIESINTENIHCISNDIAVNSFSEKIRQTIINHHEPTLVNGAQQAIDAILSLYRDYSGLKYSDSGEWYKKLLKAKQIEDATIKKAELKRLRSLVFKENIKIVSESGYLNNCGKWVSINSNDSASELFQSEIAPVNTIKLFNTIISVINQDSIDAGIALKDQGYNPLILDMACEDVPGGGVIGGCYGQEESLFRRSDLYYHTFKFTKYAPVFGVTESIYKYPLDKKYGAVYVGNANVFRHKETQGYKLMEKPYKLSFIAVAAIKNPVLIDNELSEKDIEITCLKIRSIFRISLRNNHDAIVLGAFGCGLFHNPPTSIAYCFDKVLNEPEFHNTFRKVVFAILEDSCSRKEHSKRENFQPFKEQFCK